MKPDERVVDLEEGPRTARLVPAGVTESLARDDLALVHVRGEPEPRWISNQRVRPPAEERAAMSEDEYEVARFAVNSGRCRTVIVVADATPDRRPCLRMEHLDANGASLSYTVFSANEAEALATSMARGAQWLRGVLRGFR